MPASMHNWVLVIKYEGETLYHAGGKVYLSNRHDQILLPKGLSTVYFRKLFTQVYHTSPISYVKQLRISKAKEMPRSDFGTVTAVAMSLGYANIYDFSRDFKKQTGLSPTVYIRQHTTQAARQP